MSCRVQGHAIFHHNQSKTHPCITTLSFTDLHRQPQQFLLSQQLIFCGANVPCLFIQGLDYLHYNKALHGDLKPANLLLSSERLVKIADFGSAMMYQESEGTWEGPVNGTPAFRPPETLTASGRLTRKVSLCQLVIRSC